MNPLDRKLIEIYNYLHRLQSEDYMYAIQALQYAENYNTNGSDIINVESNIPVTLIFITKAKSLGS